MKVASLLSAGLSVLMCQQLLAKDLLMPKAGDRKINIEKAQVWVQPSWINSDLEFDANLDVFNGGPVDKKDQLLMQDTVTCKVTPDDLKDSSSGKTPKFKCSLMEIGKDGKPAFVVSKKGKLDDIKVKYGVANPEIYAEVIATRLLWALGFGADRMFPVDSVNCYGCTADPFKDKRIDATTMTTPRVMMSAAIERKMEGLNMIYDNPAQSMRPGNQPTHQYPEEGWEFSEIMHFLPSPASGKLHDEKIKRDALRLLSVFMQHVDSKAANHRMVCDSEEMDKAGKCKGNVRLILQDVGATFGGGTLIKKLRISKVELDAWAAKPIWRDAANCKAKFGLTGDMKLFAPRISEEARQFLGTLLWNFSKGEVGRARVEALFRAANIEQRGGSVAEWTNAFMSKVYQIKYPMGDTQPYFKCPESVYN